MCLLLSVCVAAVALASGGSTGQLAVTGFQEENSPLRDIDRSAAALTTVGVDGVDLIRHGTDVNRPDRGALAQLARAHADHLRAELLIGNWSNRVNDFYEPIAHRMFADPAAMSRVVKSLVGDVQKQGWDGISVDLESLRQRDDRGLVAFVRELHLALPAGQAPGRRGALVG